MTRVDHCEDVQMGYNQNCQNYYEVSGQFVQGGDPITCVALASTQPGSSIPIGCTSSVARCYILDEGGGAANSTNATS